MSHDHILIVLLIILALCLSIQLYFSLFIHSKLSANKGRTKTKRQKHPVSVILSARNEAQHLREHLPSILEQKYPDFEVVVVNDCSWDETEEVLRDMASRYANLKTVTISEQEHYIRNKKFAITMGIKAAKHEHLLFTEPDCRPFSANWIAEMQSNFSGHTELVLGHTVYQKSYGLLNIFYRFSSFFTSVNYLSYALKGMAYTGSGANMAYLKSVFFRGKGFASHMHIPFGDDLLFVNQHASWQNTRMELKADSYVLKSGHTTFSGFLKSQIEQKMAFGFGKLNRAKFLIRMQSLSAILFYVLLFSLLVLNFDWRLILGVYLFKLIPQIIVYFKLFERLNYRDLKWWFPLLDLIYYIYILVLSIAARLSTKTQWK